VLQQDGHLSQAEDLSSFDLALSLHSAAPRIEAYYQYYNTSVLPLLGETTEDGCDSWVFAGFTGQRFCSPDLDQAKAQTLGRGSESLHELPFDRVLGDFSIQRPTILYADITSQSFRDFHKTVSQTAREGKTTYRVRYKPGQSTEGRSLTVSGYGVGLYLKRTDYIVIDDRQADGEEKDVDSDKIEETGGAADVDLEKEQDVSDLRPLSSSELVRLGVRASSFVMKSEDPLDALYKLSQDFPKYSGAISGMNISMDFFKEHAANREVILPSGYNVFWINGVQTMARDVDAYSLLEHLRKERKLIKSVRELGLSAAQAIDLLSHDAITASQTDTDIQRYDWRDEVEGGDVIMWLNDLEQDKRYSDWSPSVNALLQRTFPGQLPPVARDIHNLIVPTDFSKYEDVALIVETLQNFVKRKIPIRFGLVPKGDSTAAVEQAKVAYYLLDTYGLLGLLDYLEKAIESAGKKHGPVQGQSFERATSGRKLRKDREVASLSAVLAMDELNNKITSAKSYTKRLGSNDQKPIVFINGIPVPRTEEWLSTMSQRVSMDLQRVQRAVYQGELLDDNWLPEYFLATASPRRSPLVIPEDDSEVRHLDLAGIPELQMLPSLPAEVDTIERELVHITVIADFETEDGLEQLMEAMQFRREHSNVELTWLYVPTGDKPVRNRWHIGKDIDRDFVSSIVEDAETFATGAMAIHDKTELDLNDRRGVYQMVLRQYTAADRAADDLHSRDIHPVFRDLVKTIGLQPGEKAVLLNGRVVGPLKADTTLELADLETLFAYERKKRLLPASMALEGLKLTDKATVPYTFARLSNLIARSQVSDVPEGIFESAPTIRSSVYNKWQSNHTMIEVGDIDTANIQVVVAVDPASEVGQRWIPIIKTLSELEGVHVRIFLNPKERLDELPVKRFYRHVLSSKPTFDNQGTLSRLSAHFAGLPAEALLNMGMDLPPSWLVAPEESPHDLDNIKLSAVKSESDIEATYKLEHILIEGHSKDVTLGPAPRGAQLVLGTDADPHSADTIIMANLGYFQFKANPGVYNIALQKGRSEEIFHIDSAGTLGYNAQPHDNTTEIAMTSFRGVTLFPRLSRKEGMEEEDVLEASRSVFEDLADGADKLLAKAGLATNFASKYLSKAAKFGSGLLAGTGTSTDLVADPHAEINIFSVASGHLYERMLNIMMLSVMKHTEHTVKFWFIEQFLSPSFKDFLPLLAAEYGFKYEMVTYKWPHWLRGQKEKQREIWGYKILFLDVLFPLDLDKVIFVDADQIVRTDMYELVEHDLQGAPYGFTPMCDSRTEMEGFRFWKQGYWKNFLKGLPYHISALYVVDLKKFRQIAAGDRLRQQYHQLSADPNSLSNLDQDLPNHMQAMLPIHSLPQDWLWCETWCSDEALKTAKTIDLCNNPQTKEPKLDRARRQVPEWTVYDDEIASVAKKHKERQAEGRPVTGDASDAGAQGQEEESIQERLQREDAERERKKHTIDEL